MKKLLISLLFIAVFPILGQCQISEVDQVLLNQLKDTKEICKQAGEKLLEIRNSGQLSSRNITLPNGKVIRQTNADIEVSQYLLDELTKRTPSYGIISQDHMQKDPNWSMKDLVWVVNPIDGTKEYETGKDDFHIQIGLLHHNSVVLGVSYYPATDIYIWAIQNQGSWIEQNGITKKLSAVPSSKKILIRSSSHKILEPYFAKWGWIPDQIAVSNGSSTTRLLKMIQGEASLYISLGASPLGVEKKGGIWNYGANIILAKEAGLILTTLKGLPLNLREPSGLLIEGIVLTNDPLIHQTIVSTDFDAEEAAKKTIIQ